jgi:hypothetical protein
MADNKRIYKCSVCHEVGHNKAKCPTQKKEEIAETAAPAKVETKPQLETIYQIQVKEDNGDEVQDYNVLYASIDGLMKGLKEVMTNLAEYNSETYGDEEEEEEDEGDPEGVFYYSTKEYFKDVPVPTKEYIEDFLDNKKIRYMNGLLIKVGSRLGGAASFGCEISVRKIKLNP